MPAGSKYWSMARRCRRLARLARSSATSHSIRTSCGPAQRCRRLRRHSPQLRRRPRRTPRQLRRADPMPSLQPVRGTRDIMAEDARRFRRVVEAARDIAARYGYEEVATPIFEFSEVFERTLGDTSDIVTKEMYKFQDRGGDNITLRPEGTAGIGRAVISGGLAQEAPLKFFYQGPMFRYERPQKGRLRQFHQIGVELIGVAEPAGDVEAIAMGA